MAGVGFALRALMQRDTLWSIFESMLHGIIAVGGPWFFTIIGMSLPSLVFRAEDATATTTTFVALLLYIFSISLTLTSPVAIGLTRHISDCIFQEREDEVAPSLAAALLVGWLLAVPAAIAGYALLDLPPSTKALGLLAYALVCANWVVAPVVSAIRQFRALTLAYGVGTLIFWLAIRRLTVASVDDLLVGFCAGMCATNAAIFGLVLHNFPRHASTGEASARGRPAARAAARFSFAVYMQAAAHPVRAAARLLDAMRRYWDLLLGGLFYGAGIWVDKWIMWAAPEHTFVDGGLYTHPTYDTAAFVAYVTTVPALAVFIIQAETSFHHHCQEFYGAIRNHADRKTIEAARRAALASFRLSMRDVGLLQLCATALVLILPTLVLDAVGAPHLGVFAFRFCALGSAFQLGILALTIVLYYFDSRRSVLWINGLFVVTNLVFTWATVRAGLRWYGFGYFLAALVTFAWAFAAVIRTFRELLYVAFVSQNAAVVDAPPPRPPTTQWLDAVTGPGPLDTDA